MSIVPAGSARVYVPEKKVLIDVLEKVHNVNYPIWRARL
jgi:hypothetical protein